MAKMIGGYYYVARDPNNRITLLAGPFKTANEADAIIPAVEEYAFKGWHGRDYGPLRWYDRGTGYFAFWDKVTPGLFNGPLDVWVTGGEVEN